MNTHATEELGKLLTDEEFDIEIAFGFLNLGADPDVKDPKGIPFIDHLIRRNEMEKVCLLINEYGADIHLTNAQGHTPLQYLLNIQTSEEMLLAGLKLVDLGAYPLSTDNQGHTLYSKLVAAKLPNEAKKLGKLIDERNALLASDVTCLFKEKNAPEILLSLLTGRSLKQEEINKLGKYKNAKEMLIAYIEQLPTHLQRITIQEARTEGSVLNQFFLVSRGMLTSAKKGNGSMLKLKAMQEKLLHQYDPQTEYATAPPYYHPAFIATPLWSSDDSPASLPSLVESLLFENTSNPENETNFNQETNTESPPLTLINNYCPLFFSPLQKSTTTTTFHVPKNI